MNGQQFDWKNDFKNCHPSKFGHTVYASSIRRLLNKAWAEPQPADHQPTPHSLPEPLNQYSYDQGKMVSLKEAKEMDGFKIEDSCDPRANNLGGGVRAGFHNVPMLVGTQPGDQFSLDFQGSRRRTICCRGSRCRHRRILNRQLGIQTAESIHPMERWSVTSPGCTF